MRRFFEWRLREKRGACERVIILKKKPIKGLRFLKKRSPSVTVGLRFLNKRNPSVTVGLRFFKKCNPSQNRAALFY